MKHFKDIYWPRLLLAGTIAAVTAAQAWALDAATKCEAAKLGDAGKYCQCRLKAEAKAAKKGTAADFSKCDVVFSKKWQAHEGKAAGACPSNGDEGEIRDRTVDHTDAIASFLSGVDTGRCQRLAVTGQTTSYGPGDDGDLQSGVPFAFVDNGDGTITDLNTKIMWAKKVAFDGIPVECVDETGSCANPHDADNVYSWSADGVDFNGTAVTIFLEQMNNRCDKDPTVPCDRDGVDDDCNGPGEPGGACGFAGYRDWRLPNIRELLTIADWGAPAGVPAAFEGANCGPACTDVGDPACACTAEEYWSSTTVVSDPGSALGLSKGRGVNGNVKIRIKTKGDDRVGVFAIREGGRTVGAGQIGEIIK